MNVKSCNPVKFIFPKKNVETNVTKGHKATNIFCKICSNFLRKLFTYLPYPVYCQWDFRNE